MKKYVVGAITFFLFASVPVQAQSPGGQTGQGYIFTGPGVASSRFGSDTTWNLGGGGEAFVWNGVGLGAELGALWPTESFSAILGTFSVNGSYHFFGETPGRTIVPFVTTGYTLLFRDDTANLYNVGGGATYWFRRRLGARFEVRDHVWNPAGVTSHLWQFRFGLSFR